MVTAGGKRAEIRAKTTLAGASGLVIWGASSDGKTNARCHALQTYVEQSFGPAVRGIVQGREACALANCSGHGRCAERFPVATGAAGEPSMCQCFDGFDGPSCGKSAARVSNNMW